MTFLEKIDFMMNKLGINKNILSQMSGVPYTTIDAFYKKGYGNTKMSTIRKIASALDVSLDYLIVDSITDENYGKTNGFAVDLVEMTHVKKYRCLDDYGKEAVDDVLDVEYRRVTEDREKEAAAARWRSGKQKQLMRFLRQKRRETEAADEPANVQRFPVPYYLQASSAGYGEWAESGYAEEIDLVKRPPFGTSFIVPVNGDSMEPTYPDGCKVFVRRQTEIRVGEVGIFFMDGKQWIKELGEGELISHNPAYPTRPMTDDICCQGLVLGICDDSYFA